MLPKVGLKCYLKLLKMRTIIIRINILTLGMFCFVFGWLAAILGFEGPAKRAATFILAEITVNWKILKLYKMQSLKFVKK